MNRTVETAPGHTEASPEKMATLRVMANSAPVEDKDFDEMHGENSPELADDDCVEAITPFDCCRVVNIQQGTPEWLAWRNQGIGASDLGAILGMSKYETPLSIWAKKTGFAPHKDEPNENMEWGHRIEPALVDKWIEENAATYYLECRGPVFEHSEHTWMHASLDALVHPLNGEIEALECKTASSTDGWIDENGAETIPPSYMAQAVWQMAVTGIRVVHFSVLVMGHGRTWLTRTVHRDEDQIIAAFVAAWDFWQMVERQEAPQVSWTCPEADSDAIKAMFPTVNEDQSFEAGNHGEELILERSELKRKKDEIGDRIDVIENELKFAMGTAKFAKANGRKICTASSYDRESIDSKALKAAYPEIAEQFTKTTPVRTYRFAD